MRESAIERKLKTEIEKLGGLCMKLDPAFIKGSPDRLIILPTGLVWFVELKNETGSFSKLQIYLLKKLRDLGVSCWSIHSAGDVKTFIDWNETLIGERKKLYESLELSGRCC